MRNPRYTEAVAPEPRCIYRSNWGQTRLDAISYYLQNYYIAKRRHSAAGNESPVNVELANSAQLAAQVTATI